MKGIHLGILKRDALDVGGNDDRWSNLKYESGTAFSCPMTRNPRKIKSKYHSLE